MTPSPAEGTVVDVAVRGEPLTLPRLGALRLVLARALVAVPAYPALLATTFVLVKLGESWSPIQVVMRPLGVILLAVAALQLVIGAVAGRHVASYFVSLVLLVFVDPAVALLAVLAAVIPLAWRSLRARRLNAVPWPELTAPLNVIAIGALAATVVSGVTGGWFFVALPSSVSAPVGTAAADAPDIYLVLLDGYPRSDLLEAEIGLDNGPFLAAMKTLGFDVADQSHSNYGRTALTLASLFNARQVNDLVPDPPGDPAAQARSLSQLINHGAALDVARSRGYEVVSMPSPIGYVSLFAADRVVETSFATEFELTLTEQDFASRIAPQARHWLFIDQHRDRILDTFTTLARMPTERSAKPRLVFAHVLSPHAPIAFGKSGEEVMLEGCEWTLCGQPQPLPEAFKAAYAGQLQYLDTLVESTARTMIQNSSRPSVIIFFSDHGSRLTKTPDSMFDDMILSYTPGKPGLLPRDETPVNLLPRLLNAYAGANEPLAPDTSYVHPSGLFFPLVPLQP